MWSRVDLGPPVRAQIWALSRGGEKSGEGMALSLVFPQHVHSAGTGASSPLWSPHWVYRWLPLCPQGEGRPPSPVARPTGTLSAALHTGPSTPGPFLQTLEEVVAEEGGQEGTGCPPWPPPPWLRWMLTTAFYPRTGTTAPAPALASSSPHTSASTGLGSGSTWISPRPCTPWVWAPGVPLPTPPLGLPWPASHSASLAGPSPRVWLLPLSPASRAPLWLQSTGWAHRKHSVWGSHGQLWSPLTSGLLVPGNSVAAVHSPSQPACPRQEAQGPWSHPFPPQGARRGEGRRTQGCVHSSSSTGSEWNRTGKGAGGCTGGQMPWSESPPMVAGLLGWGAWPHRFPLSSPTGRARHGLRCGPSAGTLRPGLRGPSAEPGIPAWLRGGRPGGGRGEGLQEAQACVTQPPCPVTLGTLPHFALINSKQLEDYTLRCFVFSCHGDGNSSFLCLRR